MIERQRKLADAQADDLLSLLIEKAVHETTRASHETLSPGKFGTAFLLFAPYLSEPLLRIWINSSIVGLLPLFAFTRRMKEAVTPVARRRTNCSTGRLL